MNEWRCTKLYLYIHVSTQLNSKAEEQTINMQKLLENLNVVLSI